MTLLHIINVAVSWGLLSLIWLVQIIVYPGLARVAPGNFIDYHRWYVVRISGIVAPLMICEAAVAAVWLWSGSGSAFPLVSALLVGVIWMSSFLLQVPLHKQLQSGKNDARIERLVATNWVRTVAWSVKAVVALAAAAEYFSGS